MTTIFRFSEVSRILTGNRSAIRADYNRNGKYKEAIDELKEFEKNWKAKHSKQLKK